MAKSPVMATQYGKKVWIDLGKASEQKSEFLRAAYCFRMAEFFLKAGDSEEALLYEKCVKCLYKAFDTELRLSYKKYDIPYKGKFLDCIKMVAPHAKRTVLVCGGYDLFMEDLVLQFHDPALKNYDVILFEGPGQGRCLQQDLYFQYGFEKPVAAVLNFCKIKEYAMVGISWGGYFTLRSAAFEKRIKAVVAYDVMDNGFEVMPHIFPSVICKIIRFAYAHKNKHVVNGLVEKCGKKVFWQTGHFHKECISQERQTPYAFYKNISRHTLNGITPNITQNVLLLAGEKDHCIPPQQFYRLKSNLPHAHSLTCRMFTEREGGEQHCQIGKHLVAVTYMIGWLDKYFQTRNKE